MSLLARLRQTWARGNSHGLTLKDTLLLFYISLAFKVLFSKLKRYVITLSPNHDSMTFPSDPVSYEELFLACEQEIRNLILSQPRLIEFICLEEVTPIMPGKSLKILCSPADYQILAESLSHKRAYFRYMPSGGQWIYTASSSFAHITIRFWDSDGLAMYFNENKMEVVTGEALIGPQRSQGQSNLPSQDLKRFS